MPKSKSVLAVRWEDRNNRDSMRLSVSGSRVLRDERVKILLLEEIEKEGATRIVTHAEPGGVCLIARSLCKEIGMPITIHHLNYKYGRGAFYHRTLGVFYDTDYAVFIHDGKSIGTKNEYEMAQKMGVPHSYHILEPTAFNTSVAFDIEVDWKDLTDDLLADRNRDQNIIKGARID